MANKGKLYESEFEEALIQLLEKKGWNYTHGDNLPNRKETEPLVKDDLCQFLQTQYADKNLTDIEMQGIVANVANVGGQSEYESARNAISLYRNGYDFLYSDSRSTPFRLNYIDFDTPSNNIFRVVNQFTMVQGTENRRPDVLLFVNGIPVCIFELKNPTDPNATIEKAHTQICTRYMRDIPVMMKYCALAVISDAAQNKLGTPFTPYEFFYEWKRVNDEKPTAGLDTLQTLIDGALTPERLLEILRDYVYFPDPSSKEDTTEIECRYPQFFATRKLRDHILKHLRSNGGDGKGGLYFGATGCGKTYTMLFLARQLALRCKNELGSPTILIIVDREDLESQSASLFLRSKNFLEDNAVRIFESRAELKEEMTLRKSGGIFITTIQKFNEELGLLSERSNIICMSDEAHRSQNNLEAKLKVNDPTSRRRLEAKDGERKLIEADRLTDITKYVESENHNQNKTNYGVEIAYGFAQHLRTALPNATYMGFTGTPIDECKYVFGEIVDQYTMREAVKDGITVDIKYDPRLARVTQNKELSEKIEEYYKKCDEEGATAEDIWKSKTDMSSMREIIRNEDRLTEIAKDIIGDYEIRQDNSSCLQKAMITCIDRPTAYMLYKIMSDMKGEWFEPRKALDESKLTDDDKARLNPVAFVNLVATRDKDDEKDLYNLLGDKEYRKWLSNEFKSDKSNFHIAIVVDMWITGFDCPSLTVLYNDKPLHKHTLIQTISRVNRKYKTKELGFVVDYIGIQKEMVKALKMYGGDETIEVDDVDKSYEILHTELTELRNTTAEIDFTPFFSDDPLQRLFFLQKAADFILRMDDSEDGEDSFMNRFRQHVKRLKLAYDICNPAGRTTDDETKWCLCFMGISSYLTKLTSKVHDAASMNRHVEKMVSEALNANEVEFCFEKEGGDVTLFGKDFLEEIKNTPMPYTRFQLLCKLLQRAIKGLGGKNKGKADEFQKMLQETIDRYNNRKRIKKSASVANDVISGVMDLVDKEVSKLSDMLIELYNKIKKEGENTNEDKPYFDILVSVRDKHGFEYSEERCEELAVKIGEIVREKGKIPSYINNANVRADISVDIMNELMMHKYPPEFDQDIYDEVSTLVLDQLERKQS